MKPSFENLDNRRSTKQLGRFVESIVGNVLEKEAANPIRRNDISIPTQPRSASPGLDGSFPAIPTHNREFLVDRVPLDVWRRIFQYLYPSQLSAMSMVCHGLNDRVSSLPIWSTIYSKAHPDDNNHLIEEIKPIVGVSLSKDFMLYVFAESRWICELCYMVDGSNPKDQMAHLPLPVHGWRFNDAFNIKEPFLPFSEYTLDWIIKLCIKCRRDVYDRSPERTPETFEGQVVWDELQEKYGLNHQEMPLKEGIQQVHSRVELETKILTKARKKYGGDVGISASTPGSSLEAIQSMKARLRLISHRYTTISKFVMYSP
ncbi:hypothetical protein BGX31_007605 [Mortierella sp. GBA43]|nr:hypothetical protein BGX31_007605 [Mortierella sp. GBA43]